MVSLSVCAGCKGKGSYEVLNAYDPKDIEVTICEHCDGDGVVTRPAEQFSTARRKAEDEWLN